MVSKNSQQVARGKWQASKECSYLQTCYLLPATICATTQFLKEPNFYNVKINFIGATVITCALL